MSTTNDYLNSAIIKDDIWVKAMCAATTANEMVSLIMRRINSPTQNGPVPAYLSRSPSQPELPSEIVYDLVINSYADYDVADEAMGIIMKKIRLKEITPDAVALENVFHIIEQLVLERCSDDLYAWIKDNISYMDSPELEKRRTMLNAISAMAYAQKADVDDWKTFWSSLWEQGNQYWWNTAFLGIRYADFDKAVSLLPQLIERKCSNTAFLLTSMWRVKDDDRIAKALRKGLDNNDTWAGTSINYLAFKMKWAEKTRLLERLHDASDNLTLSTEEEDHLETMGYHWGD